MPEKLTRREFGQDATAVILGEAIVLPVSTATAATEPKQKATRMKDACNF